MEERVLTSWKEVAAYLGKGVRTVQRWERDLGLPVRRPFGAKQTHIVVALPTELDEWMHHRLRPRRRASAHTVRDGSFDNSQTIATLTRRLQTMLELRGELKDLILEMQRLRQQLEQRRKRR